MPRIVILGGGESGCGSAVLAAVHGADVFLSDAGAIAPKYIDMLEKYGIAYEQGGHTEALLMDADQVVKSPGIPDTAPLVEKMRMAGISVISEIEFAVRYTDARMIVITGSNGKTTTTTLVHKILAEAGYNVGLAGNIGDSFALQVATTERDWYVIELSSFQLDGMFDFRADIALLLNITPDHLDRYDHKFENYVASKMRVVQNQREGDFFIYSGDDMTIRRNMPVDLPAAKLPFSVKYCTTQGAWLAGSEMRISVGDVSMEIDAGDLKIRGRHNVYNAMAAALAALAAGVDPEQVRGSILDFGGVEHRMESVATIDGVEWINDSKATNVDSVWYALQGMTRPVVWIAGGTDKGNDYSELLDFAKGKVKALVCLGIDNEKLKSSFGGCLPAVVESLSMEDAVSQAAGFASDGDVVLLSPACASFDLFKNYEDRGRQFKQQVAALKNK